MQYNKYNNEMTDVDDNKIKCSFYQTLIYKG